jgi:hypothetical protein
LELAEFPWRWLGPAVLCAAVLAGGVVHVFEGLWGAKAGLWTLGIGLAFTVAVNLVYLFPSQFIPWGTPTPADALAYEAESGAIGTTSTGEFLPRWADRFPSPEVLGPDYAAGQLPVKIEPTALPAGASADTVSHTARETRLTVSSPIPFAATFRALYWPDWRVLVDLGAEGEAYRVSNVQITRPEGLIRAQLPAGDYQVRLRLFPTPIRRVATIISVLALVTFLGLAVVSLVHWKSGSSSNLPPKRTHGPALQSAVIGAALILGLIVTRPMADWFQVQSPPDVVYGAQYEYRADFGDQVRLLAFDLEGRKDEGMEAWKSIPAIHADAGDALPVVLYWRALAPLAANYSVFVHLDAPDGMTYASADELNPADIPTSHWPPSLYVRNPLSLVLPADLPPIRYALTVGLYDPESGARLPLTGCDGCSPGTDVLPLAQVWVASPLDPDEADVPERLDLRLGDRITLLGYELVRGDPATLTLYWRAESPPETAYNVFIHALDTDGKLIAQFDAPPLGGLYPSYAWRPGQIIADAHPIALPASTQVLAIGLYDPISLDRLPLTGADGARQPDDAVRVQVTGNR